MYFKDQSSEIFIVKDLSKAKKGTQQKYLQLFITMITRELRTPLNIIIAIL